MFNTIATDECRRYQDRRAELRIPCSGSAEITVLNDATFTRHVATVIDVSRSGLELELNGPLEPGARIKIQLNNTVIIGQVLNLRTPSSGCYRIGVLASLVYRPDDSDIIPSLQALNRAVMEHRQSQQDEPLPLSVSPIQPLAAAK